MNRYQGDTPSKAIARALFWSSVPRPTPENPALVLASREGRDVVALMSLGVSPESIVAVDRDPDALRECERALPGAARFECGDVVAVAERLDLKPSVSFLDFCAQAHPKLLDATCEIAVRTLSVIATVTQCGRESDNWRLPLVPVDAYIESVARSQLPDSWDQLPRVRRRMVTKRLRRLIASRWDPVAGSVFPGIRIEGSMLVHYVLAGIREADPRFALGYGRRVEHPCRSEEEEIATLAKLEALARRCEALTTVLDIVLTTRRGLSTQRIFSLRYRGHQVSMCLSANRIVRSAGCLEDKGVAPFFAIPDRATEKDLHRIAAHIGDAAGESAFLSALQPDAGRLAAAKAVSTREQRAFCSRAVATLATRVDLRPSGNAKADIRRALGDIVDRRFHAELFADGFFDTFATETERRLRAEFGDAWLSELARRFFAAQWSVRNSRKGIADVIHTILQQATEDEGRADG